MSLSLRRSAALILDLALGSWLLMIVSACGILIAGQGVGEASALLDLALRWCLT